MENYFNYFTEIEEHFCKRRGTLITLSPLDWALMEIWKEAGVPLEAVYHGIDATFEKWERRTRQTRKINGLGFCAQEVLAATEEMKDAAVGASPEKKAGPGLEHAQVAEYLVRNAELLDVVEMPGSINPAQDAARTLRAFAASIQEGRVPDMEDLERHMTVIEEKLLGWLLAATPDEALIAVRTEADRDLASYRSKMTAPQIERLHKQYVQKRILERYRIPRLSLFYMQ